VFPKFSFVKLRRCLIFKVPFCLVLFDLLLDIW